MKGVQNYCQTHLRGEVRNFEHQTMTVTSNNKTFKIGTYHSMVCSSHQGPGMEKQQQQGRGCVEITCRFISEEMGWADSPAVA